MNSDRSKSHSDGGQEARNWIAGLRGTLLSAFPTAAVWEESGSTRIEVSEAEVEVRITADEVDVRIQSVRWDGPCTPLAVTRRWKKVDLPGLSEDQLIELVQSAAAARRRQYRPCRYCGESFPPEHRVSRNVCHSCATRHLGVVF